MAAVVNKHTTNLEEHFANMRAYLPTGTIIKVANLSQHFKATRHEAWGTEKVRHGDGILPNRDDIEALIAKMVDEMNNTKDGALLIDRQVEVVFAPTSDPQSKHSLQYHSLPQARL